MSGPDDLPPDAGEGVLGDNLDVLTGFPAGSFQLVYIDPPFNTGARRTRRAMSVRADPDGDRTGFAGRRYRTELGETRAYADTFADYRSFIEPRLREARRLLTASGTLYFHIDQRESHYCKVLLDEIFGRDAFLNEIIWAYDFGGRARDRLCPARRAGGARRDDRLSPDHRQRRLVPRDPAAVRLDIGRPPAL